jgi:hypothetical protein
MEKQENPIPVKDCARRKIKLYTSSTTGQGRAEQQQLTEKNARMTRVVGSRGV